MNTPSAWPYVGDAVVGISFQMCRIFSPNLLLNGFPDPFERQKFVGHAGFSVTLQSENQNIATMKKQKKPYFRPESSILMTDFEPLCHVQAGSGEYQNGRDIDVRRRPDDEDWPPSEYLECEGEEIAYGSLW